MNIAKRNGVVWTPVASDEPAYVGSRALRLTSSMSGQFLTISKEGITLWWCWVGSWHPTQGHRLAARQLGSQSLWQQAFWLPTPWLVVGIYLMVYLCSGFKVFHGVKYRGHWCNSATSRAFDVHDTGLFLVLVAFVFNLQLAWLHYVQCLCMNWMSKGAKWTYSICKPEHV